MATSSGQGWQRRSSGKAAEKQRKNSGKAAEKQQKSTSRSPILPDPVLTSPTSAFHHGSIGSGDGSGWSGHGGGGEEGGWIHSLIHTRIPFVDSHSSRLTSNDIHRNNIHL